MNTETLPPLNVAALPGVELVRTYRLSLSFTMSITFGPADGACWAAIDSAPAASITASRTLRFISNPPKRKKRSCSRAAPALPGPGEGTGSGLPEEAPKQRPAASEDRERIEWRSHPLVDPEWRSREHEL